MALRVPDAAIPRAVVERFGLPITATSANLQGASECTHAACVRDQIGDRIPLIIDGGPTARSQPTTIVDLSLGPRPLGDSARRRDSDSRDCHGSAAVSCSHESEGPVRNAAHGSFPRFFCIHPRPRRRHSLGWCRLGLRCRLSISPAEDQAGSCRCHRGLWRGGVRWAALPGLPRPAGPCRNALQPRHRSADYYSGRRRRRPVLRGRRGPRIPDGCGCSGTAIIAETESRNTEESARRLAVIARTNGFHRLVVVSDETHLFRIHAICAADGLNVLTSPRPRVAVEGGSHRDGADRARDSELHGLAAGVEVKGSYTAGGSLCIGETAGIVA